VSFIRGVYDAVRVAKLGTWLYAGEVTRDVRIVYSPISWALNDSDEEPAPQDIRRDTFYVEWGSITERGVFNGGGGGFPSLDEAMRHVEKMLQGVRWVD